MYSPISSEPTYRMPGEVEGKRDRDRESQDATDQQGEGEREGADVEAGQRQYKSRCMHICIHIPLNFEPLCGSTCPVPVRCSAGHPSSVLGCFGVSCCCCPQVPGEKAGAGLKPICVKVRFITMFNAWIGFPFASSRASSSVASTVGLEEPVPRHVPSCFVEISREHST